MNNHTLPHIIRQGLAGLFHICSHELKQVFKDQGVLIFFLLVPLAYPLIYAFMDVPAAVVDLSNTAQSREFLRLVDASADVRIQSHCTDMEEAKTLLKETKVYGIIYIPADCSAT